MRRIVYPSGTIATAPDTVTANFTLTHGSKPTEAASITRCSCSSPGGRVGDALVADILAPTATAVGKCLVFFSGHNQAAEGWAGSLYCGTDGSSVIRRVLASGWHVLASDMPAYGQQGSPFHVTLGGVLTAVPYLHPFSAGIGDGGPSVTRIFHDHVFRAMSYAQSSLGLTKFALLGHSGGSCTAATAAALDDRFAAVHLCGVAHWWPTGSATECEAYPGIPDIAALGATMHDLYLAAAAAPGRKTVYHVSPTDEYNPGQFEPWSNEIPYLSEWVGSAFGASAQIRSKDTQRISPDYEGETPYHDIDTAQAEWIANHLIENL